MRHRGVLALLVALGLQLPAGLRAQSGNSADGRLEVSGGVSWTGGIPFTTLDAREEDRNGDPYVLFVAASELRRAVSYGARIGLRLTGRFAAESSLSYSSPELVVRVRSDVEDAAAARLAETIGQIQIDGGIVMQLTPWRAGQRNIPFVTAGAGYLRELHDAQTLLVDGRSYYLGAGIKRVLTVREGSWLKAAGARFDGRLFARRKGVGFDERTRLAPWFGASLFIRF